MKALSFAAALVLALFVAGCNRAESSKQTPKPEKTGVLKGTLVSRNVETKSISIDHEKIEGMMDAMKMSWEVRGQSMDQLPPDGTKITATAHEQDDRYWVTDVKAAQ